MISNNLGNKMKELKELLKSKLEDPDFYAGGKSYSKAYVEWKEYLKKEYGDKKL